MTLKKTFPNALKLCGFGALVGVLGGTVGACFSHLLSFVTGLRLGAPWIILLLPLGGIATVLLYRFFGMQDHGGANEIVLCLENRKPIRTLAAPLIFICSALTHLFGGSAGREGAALQLGGAGSAWMCRLLRIKEEERTAVVMSGMSAVFAGLFGAPLTAAFFVLEFRIKRKILGFTWIPCFISAFIASEISSLLAVDSEAVRIDRQPDFSAGVVIKTAVLALAVGVLGRFMCFAFHKAGHLAKRMIPYPVARTVAMSAVAVAMTVIVGDMRYNGSGMEMAMSAVEGSAHWFDFLLKLLFTAVTLAAGLKGGEIVPTFCIGATFGCFLGSVLGLDPAFAAALGLVGLFCCVANSPVGAVFLGIELLGFSLVGYYIFICLMILPVSANEGLFKNRIFEPKNIFSKWKFKNRC